MRALTVKPPWAWAIIHGGKDIENRSWRTHFRGRIAIHASKTFSRSEYEAAKRWCSAKRLPLPPYEDLHKGAILGTVELVGCEKPHRSRWYIDGNYGFVLSNPKPRQRHRRRS